MLSVDVSTLRLFLHVLAAAIWVGGQLTLAGLVPALRAFDAGAPRAAARAFNRVAWPAFLVVVVTGIWNLVAVDVADANGRYHVTLAVKVALVTASGIAAGVHAAARGRVALAAGGAVAGVTSLGALFFGVLLHG